MYIIIIMIPVIDIPYDYTVKPAFFISRIRSPAINVRIIILVMIDGVCRQTVVVIRLILSLSLNYHKVDRQQEKEETHFSFGNGALLEI
jgi:Mg2+/citrate symporter